jgi:hypothetical protein
MGREASWHAMTLAIFATVGLGWGRLPGLRSIAGAAGPHRDSVSGIGCRTFLLRGASMAFLGHS